MCKASKSKITSICKIVKAQVWIKVREFSGVPMKDDFKLVEEELPALKDGGRTVTMLLK